MGLRSEYSMVPMTSASICLGIALDEDGFIYVSDTGNHRVQKFTRTERLWHNGRRGFESGTAVGEFNSPRVWLWISWRAFHNRHYKPSYSNDKP